VLATAHVSLLRVEYRRETQTSIVMRHLEWADQCLDSEGRPSSVAWEKAIVRHMLVSLADDMVTFKAPDFAAEQEWRASRLIHPGQRLMVNSRIRKGVLTPYFPVSLNRATSLMSGIGTSPAGDQELAKRGAEALLQHHGGVPVIRSTPY